MRTINQLALFLTASIFLLSCGKVTYRKTAGGMPYQLYKGKDTQRIFSGNIVKANFRYKVKDSVYFSSFETVPVYIPVNPTPLPYDISEVWTTLRVGDSVIATQMMDTFIKRNPMQVPPEFKKGDRIITTARILAVFSSDSAAGADRAKTEKEWAEKEIDQLAKYLASKNIKAQKTASGAFVEIINPGTGNLIDTGKYVAVNYTGTHFSGVKFDSNTDTAFRHAEPLYFTVNGGRMTKGFDETVRLMRLGGSARAYIPSMLVYGGNPPPGSGIKPYESLIFDMSVVDVKDSAPPQKPEMVSPNKKVDATQQQK